ncbi:MAG: hypothetical protein ACLSH3_15885 [Alistipes finegoldii]
MSLYNSPAERETEIKNMSTVFEELKKGVAPELRAVRRSSTAPISKV